MDTVRYLIRGWPAALAECSAWLAGWYLPPRVYRVVRWINPWAWVAGFHHTCTRLAAEQREACL